MCVTLEDLISQDNKPYCIEFQRRSNEDSKNLLLSIRVRTLLKLMLKIRIGVQLLVGLYL